MGMKDIKVTATLKVIVTGEFYDFEASEETLRSCVEQDLEEVGFDVDVELLKEQKPKSGHWIFESQYCEAWSHTCSECGKRMTTAVNTFANWCWNCGAKMGGEHE